MAVTNFEPPEHQDQSWMRWVFWLGIVLTILGWNFILSGCSPKITETIRVEKEYVYRDSIAYRDSLIKVPPPIEEGNAIVAVGDTARRETSIAEAAAWVDTLGHLNLELRNKRRNLEVLVPIPTHTIFTGVTTNQVEIRQVIREVPKPLSWWQNLKIRAFWGLLGAVLLLLLWAFRKPLLKLIGL